MFEKNFLEKIKKNLEKEKIKIEKEIAKARKFPSYGSSEDENAQELEEFTEKLGVQAKLKGLLANINTALKKIAKGAYGQCESCKKPIEKNRLTAMPTALLCVVCASKKRQ